MTILSTVNAETCTPTRHPMESSVPDTTFAVRRVSVASALRVGLVVGPAVALVPALPLAVLLDHVLHQVSQRLGGITPFELRAFGQSLARFDWLALLGLQDVAQTTGRLAALGWLTFLVLTLLLTLGVSLLLALAALLGALTYNAASAVAGGLQVELRPRSDLRGAAPTRKEVGRAPPPTRRRRVGGDRSVGAGAEV